ncbi:ABC-type multidrug transport system fused ATPase/permease subunit [Actinocorallia herbida]|uniref:ABC-type multidrug transport system fused ATPase/permease subunit n=1 Tax=Actinocorallia herbida TaxID=58109 RepID=A0A3N1CNX1_9ACTN|nr:ABC transporter ATP-binding protein [Actinocorallia herbida]ROO82864.1 ABC-type multidrug transport system fused ATPase/permease subunit [Actinocorallia herbida]
MRDLPVRDPGTPADGGPWRFLSWLTRAEAPAFAATAAWSVVGMTAQALMPAAVGRAVDEGITARDAGALGVWAGVLLGLGLLMAVARTLGHVASVRVWLGAAYRTVQVVSRQAGRLGESLARRIGSGEVITVGTGDVVKLGSVVEVLGRAVGAALAIGTVTVVLLGIDLRLGLVLLLGVPAVLALSGPLLGPIHRRQSERRDLTGEMTATASDIVAGLRVLRGIGGEALFERRFRAESQRVREAGTRAGRAEAWLNAAAVLFPGLLLTLVTWLGARYTAAGEITVGQLVACYGYAAFLVTPLWVLGEAAGHLTRGHVAAARVVRILRMTPDHPGDGVREPSGGELADDASGLRIRPGLLTAVVAGQEAGALADRLAGYTGESGVTYGGVPLAELAGLRRRILYAAEGDVLFTGPLRAELLPEGPDERIASAVRAASADDVLAEAGGLAEGTVAEAGREFSGGQRQRLRLARALAADAEVLLLVEPTSAVDAHTEAAIAERLAAHRAGRTTVVFTGSPLVLAAADHVVHVQRGKVAAEGGHADLMAEAPGYRAAVTRQLGGPGIPDEYGPNERVPAENVPEEGAPDESVLEENVPNEREGDPA